MQLSNHHHPEQLAAAVKYANPASQDLKMSILMRAALYPPLSLCSRCDKTCRQPSAPNVTGFLCTSFGRAARKAR